MQVIFISGIFMAFFIVLLLLTKRGKALTDKILASWMAVIGIHLFGYLLNRLGYWEIYPHLIGVTAPLPLLHGPFLFLYSKYAWRGEQKIRKKDYLHFLPTILAYVHMSRFFFFYSAEQKMQLDRGEIDDYSTFTIITLIAMLISGITYAVFTYLATQKHRERIEDHYSYQKGINLNWLRILIISIGLVFFTAAMVIVPQDVLHVEFTFNPEYIFYTMLIVFIFYTGYFGIKFENILTDHRQMQSGETLQGQAKEKNAGPQDEAIVALYENLQKLMTEQKPHLDPKLSLPTLASMLDVSTNKLSQAINQQAKVNFYDFVNKHRIDEFLKGALKNKHFSLLALALDSGFNSKSSFNHIFKKHKGVTPSQYLKKTPR